MSRYKELQEQIALLQKQAEEARQQEVAAVIAEIKAKMDEYGITPQDLGFSSRRRSRGKTNKGQPRYRNPSTGETWTGIGRKPAWLREALSQGKTLADFAI